MFLWGGFVVCATAQIIVLSLVNAQFHNRTLLQGHKKAGIVLWLMFIPAMVFGLLVDIEIIVQLK